MKRVSILLFIFLSLRVSGTMAYKKIEYGVEVQLPRACLRLEVINANIYHVRIAPRCAIADRPSLSVIQSPLKTNFWLYEHHLQVTIATEQSKVIIDPERGELSFFDVAGQEYLRTEGPNAHSFMSSMDGADSTYQVQQLFHFPAQDGLYGLGQFEDGVLNMRRQNILLAQANRVAVNPFLVTSQGCGLLWDNYSLTQFQDQAGGTFFTSEAGDQIDYYVVIGASMDEAIAGYRLLTGNAPLFPRWAYGYFQSKERYRSAAELVDIVAEYRRRGLPLDVIVQDWSYWGGAENFSGMAWDPQFYPDPKGMTRQIHDLNAHLMVSIWPAFGPASAIYREMADKGLLFPEPHWSGSRVYDAYDAEARAIYWRHVKTALLDQGVDAFWMDGTEPEFRCTDDRFITAASIKANGRCALGPISRYATPYSLLTTQGVYDGQRQAAPDKRVFILTRSAFAGQQRHAAVTWSGDTFAGWQVLRNQITAGLTFCMSGIPYWTADIGGFLTHPLFPQGCADPAYRELYVRWFQFGAFCPVFRSHGTSTPREIWQFGEPGTWAYDALLQADQLRYRLLPYIYSQAAQITQKGSTLMRGLPMDFPNDPVARDLGSQFMFGPGLMVCPVTHPMRFVPAEQAEAIPSRFLFGADSTQLGLDLSLYDDHSFTHCILKRKLDQSSLGWFGCLPAGLDSAYSARIIGHVQSPDTGKYRLTLTTDGPVRLWFDRQLVIDGWENQKPHTFAIETDLRPQKKYPIQIDHQQWQPRQANLRLAWESLSTSPGNDKINVYLPPGARWFDFWSGAAMSQEGWQPVAVPIDHIPLFVPAGTILPLGPIMQYATERPADPLELRIYPGEDAFFKLYEDENDGYGYEEGAFASIAFHWLDDKKQLEISAREGSYPGMLLQRTFQIVVVGPAHGAGMDATSKPDKIITYTGGEVSLIL